MSTATKSRKGSAGVWSEIAAGAELKPEWPDIDCSLPRPGPESSIVEDLRYSLSWSEYTPAGLETITGVDRDRIAAFMAGGPGGELTLQEAAELAKVVELRMIDGRLPDEYEAIWEIARHCLEASNGSFRGAVSRARAVAKAARAAGRPSVRIIR